MSDISIAEAKNRLPALLREVASGEALRITRRGRIVAVVLGLKEYKSLVAAAKGRPSLEAIRWFKQALKDYQFVRWLREAGQFSDKDSWPVLFTPLSDPILSTSNVER